MPSRVVRGEINASRSLSRVSMAADLTFRALLVAVDDFGRCESDPLMLKACLFPRRPDVTPEMIETWIVELERERCVQRYEVDGMGLLQLVAWERHRSNSKRGAASKFPQPPGDEPPSRNSPGDSRESADAQGIRESPEFPVVSRPSVSGSVSGSCRLATDEVPGEPPRGKNGKPTARGPSARTDDDEIASLQAQAALDHPQLDPYRGVVAVVWSQAKGAPPNGAKLHALDSLLGKQPLPRIVQHLRRYLATGEARFHSLERFVETFLDHDPSAKPRAAPGTVIHRPFRREDFA